MPVNSVTHSKQHFDLRSKQDMKGKAIVYITTTVKVLAYKFFNAVIQGSEGKHKVENETKTFKVITKEKAMTGRVCFYYVLNVINFANQS